MFKWAVTTHHRDQVHGHSAHYTIWCSNKQSPLTTEIRSVVTLHSHTAQSVQLWAVTQHSHTTMSHIKVICHSMLYNNTVWCSNEQSPLTIEIRSMVTQHIIHSETSLLHSTAMQHNDTGLLHSTVTQPRAEHDVQRRNHHSPRRPGLWSLSTLYTNIAWCSNE